MKKLFQIGINQNILDLMVLVLRLCIAIFMIMHGFPKLEKLLAGGEIKFANPFGLGPAISLALVVFAEFFCSILIGIGLATRLAAIPLIITMFVAAFITHGADPFARKEMALLYLLIYLILLVVGSGKYSVDYFLTRKK